jgi:hypothetical protein
MFFFCIIFVFFYLYNFFIIIVPDTVIENIPSNMSMIGEFGVMFFIFSWIAGINMITPQINKSHAFVLIRFIFVIYCFFHFYLFCIFIVFLGVPNLFNAFL